MNSSDDPFDRLVDSLLRKQAKGQADEVLLQEIEAALDSDVRQRDQRSAKRRRRQHYAVAATLVFASMLGLYVHHDLKARERSRYGNHGLSSGVGEMAGPPGGWFRESEKSPSLPEPVATPDPALLPQTPAEAPALADGKSTEGNPSNFWLQSPSAPSAGRGETEGLAANGRRPRQRILPPSSEPAKAPVAPGALAGNQVQGRMNSTGPGSGRGSGAGVGIGMGADAAVAEAKMKMVPGEAPVADRMVEDLTLGQPGPEQGGGERYGSLVDQPWKSPWKEALSTFSIDVDTASYTNLRRMILEGRSVPRDAVRIEECVNYFDYGYEGPMGEAAFAVRGDIATSPWAPGRLLARVAIKGRELENQARPVSNLVFLIDVSGSMQSPDKLPLLKRSMRVLIDQLDERDRVAMVVYASTEGVVLPPTLLDERGKSAAIQALEKLEAGGSTNGGSGIRRAYDLATQNFVKGGVNRVILATDGDFNVGTTNQGDLVNLVKQGADKGVSLSVTGFGTGNLNDAMMEAITNKGNGNYFYIDGDAEARRVFLDKLTGTLVTIAKDVKIQVEFNPGKVQAYRLIGYANRILNKEDFNNDKVDAGDIGAGHTVTAFYEIIPAGAPAPAGMADDLRYQRPGGVEAVKSDDWFTLKLRHKHPDGDVSALMEAPVKGEPVVWEQAGNDFRFASAVALFGMKLRGMEDAAGLRWGLVREIAGPALAEDPKEQRAGFMELVKKLGAGEDHEALIENAGNGVLGREMAELHSLQYLRDESTMWYVQFGFETAGKWSPRLIGRGLDGKQIQNKVSALEPLSAGDTFFKDGPMANCFKFIEIVEDEMTSKRTGLTLMVKIAIFEDLRPNKKGVRYESQAGVHDTELNDKAYHDRVAILRIRPRDGGAAQELKIEERTGFTVPGMKGSFFLKQVTPESVIVERTLSSGHKQTREIPRWK